RADVACGGDPSLDNAWDLDPARDSDGDGDLRNDRDAVGCDLTLPFPGFGSHELVAMSRDGAGCKADADLVVTLVEPPPPSELHETICPRIAASLSCGIPDPAAAYWWDLDLAFDRN